MSDHPIQKVISSLLYIIFSVYSFNSFANPAIESLAEEANNESIFIIEKEHRSCPEAVIVKKTSEIDNIPSDENVLSLFLSPSKADGSSDRNFTFEGNSVRIRTNLPSDKLTSFDRDLSWVNGPAYSYRYQSDFEGVIEAGYGANIIIIKEFGMMYSRYKFTFDSINKTIKYFFDGNGVDSVTCLYRK